MSAQTETASRVSRPGLLRTGLMLALPALLLAGVIAVFLATDGAGLRVAPAAPIETLQVEQTLLRTGEIDLMIQNTSPQDLSIAQVVINDSFWQFDVAPSGAIPRLGKATIRLEYPWVEAEAYQITLISANAIAFPHVIAVATETRTANTGTLLSFTLIGLYVGLIPVLLGMLWLPVLRLFSQRWLTFFLAVTIGLLIFLGIDATSEALELAGQVGGAFQGVGIVGIGIVGTFMLLHAIAQRQASRSADAVQKRLSLATMVAFSIGLHNLGEGLAIGASFAVGAAALGTFLVIGFIIQNITEGLAIVTPVVNDRPSLARLAFMGVVGGAPAIAGAWLGGLTYSLPLGVLFLSVGAGAVFVVVYQLFKTTQTDAKYAMPLTTFAGVTVGMLMLWVTGLFIK
ncbi:MAG: hypothetical protein KA750_11420 [Thermoflexales bacterium]|nr:hypothetical protein [Thermoflexales bacterium]